jgi:hypothetical protein
LDTVKPITLSYELGILKERLTPVIKENNPYQDGDFLERIKSFLLNHPEKSLTHQNPAIIQPEIKV